ncbi:MAG: AAA family ATPase [Sulfobacillus sp.]
MYELPDELIEFIAVLAGARGFSRLSQVCRRFYRVLSRAEGMVPSKCRSWRIAQEIVSAEDRLFMILGPGGCGKSFTIGKLAKLCRRRDVSLALTASTGIAAYGLGGITIHSFAGLNMALLRMTPESLRVHLFDGEKPRPIPGAARWRDTDILVVDEVSMLSDRLLEMLELCARSARGIDAPFGGIKLVLVGDFYQLPPVGGRSVRGHPLLVGARIFELSKPIRQIQDPEFFQLLSRLRLGNITLRDIANLNSRVGKEFPPELEPTKIYFANLEVDSENQRRFAAIEEPVQVSQVSTCSYWQKIAGPVGFSYVPGTPDEGQLHRGNRFQARTCPKLLEFKNGAQYVLTKNLSVKRGLVNGSRCCYRDGTLRFASGEELPLDEHLLSSFTCALGNPGNMILRVDNQFPLRLGYATTVHSCQGMTLDCASVNLNGPKRYQMVYVALSRVRTLDSLFLGAALPLKKFKIVSEKLKLRLRLRLRLRLGLSLNPVLTETAKPPEMPKKIRLIKKSYISTSAPAVDALPQKWAKIRLRRSLGSPDRNPGIPAVFPLAKRNKIRLRSVPAKCT